MLNCNILTAQFIAQSLVGLCTTILTITIPIIYEFCQRRKERRRQVLGQMYGELLAAMDFVVIEYTRYNVARKNNNDNEQRWRELQNSIMPYVYKAQVILSQGELIFKGDNDFMRIQNDLKETFLAYINEANTQEAFTKKYKNCREQFENAIQKRIKNY